jgi:hypothetical protein
VDKEGSKCDKVLVQSRDQKGTLVSDEASYDLLGRTYLKACKDSEFGLQAFDMPCTLVDEYQYFGGTSSSYSMLA